VNTRVAKVIVLKITGSYRR